MTKLLQRLVGASLLMILVGAAACTSTTAPSPAANAPSTKPAASEAARAVPTATPAAKPNEKPGWKDEWDKLVAAAKKEGKVTIAGGPSELYRTAAMAFQKAYPEIQVEFTANGGGPFGPKVQAERQAGQYLWDACYCGWNTPLTLKVQGILDPLKPVLLLPEVLDDSKWRGGLDAGWVDKERQSVYEFEGRLTFMSWVNRGLAPESELRTVDQLVDPKWKGKIAVQDPRVPGVMSTALGYLMSLKGEDWIRKLLAQDLTIVNEGRQHAEGLVRGRFPIAMGVSSADFEQFTREGLMGNIKPLEGDTASGARVTAGFAVITLINKAPHPNAAKLHINWLLSQEGQKAYTEATNQNSRRLDVAGPAETAPRAGVKYEVSETEESPLKANTDKAVALAKELLK